MLRAKQVIEEERCCLSPFQIPPSFLGDNSGGQLYLQKACQRRDSEPGLHHRTRKLPFPEGSDSFLGQAETLAAGEGWWV